MTDVPSITIEQIRKIKDIVPGNANITAVLILDDYKNNGIFLSSISEVLSMEEPAPVFLQIKELNINKLKARREEQGYIMPVFRPEAIFSPEEIAGLRSDVAEKIVAVEQKVMAINSLGVDDEDIRRMCSLWDEVIEIIHAPYDPKLEFPKAK